MTSATCSSIGPATGATAGEKGQGVLVLQWGHTKCDSET